MFLRTITDKHSRDFPSLEPGDKVRIRSNRDTVWRNAEVSARSYLLPDEQGRIYRRNTREIISVPNDHPMTPRLSDSPSSTHRFLSLRGAHHRLQELQRMSLLQPELDEKSESHRDYLSPVRGDNILDFEDSPQYVTPDLLCAPLPAYVLDMCMQSNLKSPNSCYC